jgi:selenium metabolism protein YedF
MPKTVDARGLGCPQPVIMAKKALEASESIIVIVDNRTAMENVRRLGAKLGCSIEIEDSGGEFRIHLVKGSPAASNVPEGDKRCDVPSDSFNVAISSDSMGTGNDELGRILMKAFVHTLIQSEMLPGKILFYNSGVRLASTETDTLDDLKNLEASGVELLLCGTCVNFFGLTGRIGAGRITNMFEILSVMSSSGKLIRP